MKIYWMKATLILLAICGLILWRISADVVRLVGQETIYQLASAMIGLSLAVGYFIGAQKAGWK